MNLKNFKLKYNSKIKLKCFFTLILVFTMVISPISNINIFADGREEFFYEETNECYYYYNPCDYTNPEWVGYFVKDYPGLQAVIIDMDKTESGNLYTYCIDPLIDPKEDIGYSIVDIEDVKDYENYYADDNYNKIRYIVANSIPKQLDISKIKSTFGIFDIENEIGREINLKEKQVVTATQLAIWHYSNNFIDENASDKELMYRNGNDLSEEDNYNIKTLYRAMINRTKNLDDSENGNEQIDIAKIFHKDPIVSINKYNPNNIDVEFILKIDGDKDTLSDINYKVKLNNSEINVNPIYSVGDDFVHIKVNNIPLETDIKVIASAKQDLGDGGVYFLKPEGGRNKSQSLVGVKSGVIDIYKELNYKCIQLQGIKKLTGKDLEEGMFNFKVYKGAKEIGWGTNDENGNIEFSPIIYNKEGLHEYIIEEEKGNSSNILYDETKFEVTVDVTRNNDGTLAATAIYPNGGVVFNNRYKEESTSAMIKATKTLTGKNLIANMFKFKLLDEDGNVVETVTNDAAGNIKFSELTFDEVGTYTYQIVEANEGLDGMIYDSQPVDVKIKVEDKDGKLEASVSYPSKDPEFKNEYKPGSTSAVIEATKTLEGKDLESGMFSFELLDEEDNILQTVKNSRNGKVHFKAITYDKAGTYKYTVKEVKETLDGIDYDNSEYEVTVKVTDDGKGNLVSEVMYPEGGLVFNNSYKVGTTSATIEGTKKLTGKDLEEGMFSFELLDEDNKVLQTVKNSVDGKVQFAAITYDKAGTYKYTVKEVKGTLDGIDYDDSEYEVTVKVTDDGKGNLVSEVIYPEGGLLFENIATEGSVKLIKVDKDDNEKE